MGPRPGRRQRRRLRPQGARERVPDRVATPGPPGGADRRGGAGTGHRRDTGVRRQPGRRLALRLWVAAQAASGDRAALLRAADRGGDRRPDGHLGRHGEEPEQPRPRRAPSRPARPSRDHRRGVRPMTAEELLTRTLAQVADATDYPAIPMATVVARSRAVRGTRRRRVAFVAAAAVVVVGGLSAAVALGGGGDHSPPGPAGPLGDLQQGAPPRVDYLEGDTFVTTSGERITSPRFAKAAAAVAWKNGVLTAPRPTSRHPLPTITFVSGGAPASLGCGTPSFAVPAGGADPVYWLSSQCDPHRG